MLKTVSSAGGAVSNGFPIILGNTSIAAGSTTTTLGNLTLNNVVINGTTENGVQFSNVNVISGNIGNVGLSNVTIQSGSMNVTTFNHLANVSITATYGNASLPLQPLGFINYDLNGTVVKVPYYAV
jgi:hypothetical protein